MTPEDRRTLLEGIATEVRGCTRCRLAETRTIAVPGEGHPETEVVFVGEGPGFNEDQQGRPFVGAAGALLTELLAAVGWRRDEVFITNVVKCRPPGNRDPEPDEMAACRPYLERQLDALDPALVVTLGRFSLGTFLPGSRIGESHGQTRRGPADGVAPEATVYPMYHPAAAFRQTALRETLLEDMLGVPRALLDARDRRVPATPEPSESGPGEAQPVPAEPAEPADVHLAPVPAPALPVPVGADEAVAALPAPKPTQQRSPATSLPPGSPDPSAPPIDLRFDDLEVPVMPDQDLRPHPDQMSLF